MSWTHGALPLDNNVDAIFYTYHTPLTYETSTISTTYNCGIVYVEPYYTTLYYYTIYHKSHLIRPRFVYDRTRLASGLFVLISDLIVYGNFMENMIQILLIERKMFHDDSSLQLTYCYRLSGVNIWSQVFIRLTFLVLLFSCGLIFLSTCIF